MIWSRRRVLEQRLCHGVESLLREIAATHTRFTTDTTGSLDWALRQRLLVETEYEMLRLSLRVRNDIRTDGLHDRRRATLAMRIRQVDFLTGVFPARVAVYVPPPPGNVVPIRRRE